MNFRSSVRAALVVLLLGLAPTGPAAGGQLAASTGAATVPLSAVVPVDPRIKVGTLPNGLRYYIRANQAPRNRAELRLVVSAGSILEDENQRGLAHMVEHMAFNGSKNFPNNRIVAFMQAIGMRFGAHVNAHTGFDETVFQLQIPTEDPLIVDRSFLVLEDWAQNVTFDPDEIDKERGVVLEEWRLGLGPDARMRDSQLPVLLKGSRYAERMPIGTPEILRTFRPEALTKFYADWYRPDLMAVIAVGDFDPAAIERLITAHFGPIPARTNARPKPTFDVPGHPETLYTIATDPEATSTVVNVMSTMPERDQTTIGAYRQSLVERLFAGMLSDRLDELAHTPDPPFLAAQTDRSRFIGPSEATSLVALVTDNGIERGMTALFAEAERVKRFGFTASELDRQKANMRLFLERASIEEATWESDRLADEYARNFLQKEPIPGIGYEYALHQRFVPEITLAEVNALANDWMPDRNRVVAVNAPRKPGVTMPTNARLGAAIDAGGKVALKAYVDTVSTQPLLDPLPAPGRVVKTTPKADLGITEWELSNGVRVVLRPTTFKQDEIVFRATSPGGTSLASDADFIAAETADTVISRSGLGTLTESNLEKALAGKNAFVAPEISATDEGLRGGASRGDLETMFQLIYLTFTQPRADAEAFKTLTSQWAATLANRQALPDAVFSDAVEEAVTQGHPRAKPLSTAQLPADAARYLAGVLQESVRRRQRLHVRVRRDDRPRRDQAAGRALSRQPAVAAQARDRPRRRHPAARRHRRSADQERSRPAEPGLGGVHRAVPEHADQSHHSSRDGRDAGRQPAANAARGSRRDLRRQRVAGFPAAPPRLVSRDDLVCVRSGATQCAGRRAVPRHRTVPAHRPVAGAGRRTDGWRWRGILKPTAAATRTC